MKPSEMSNEELAEGIEFEVSERPKSIAHLVSDDYYLEAAARLRNSIPKPVVEVGHWVGDLWVVTINGTVESEGYAKEMAESHANALRTALGINDTEGGV